MEVSYELTSAELSRAGRMVLLRKPVYRVLLGFCLVLLLAAAVLLVAAITAVRHSGPPVVSHPATDSGALLVLLGLAVTAVFLLTRVPGPSPQSVQIDFARIVVSRPAGRFEAPWAGIQEITSTRDGLVLVPKTLLPSAADPSARLDIVTIPKRAFADDAAAEAFRQAALGFWKAAVKTSKVGTPGVWPPPPR